MNYELRIKNEKFVLLIFSSFLLSSLFSCQTAEKIKFEQYYIAGAQIYVTNCANCHQKDGLGLKNLYPPIKNSEYLADKNSMICLIKNGLTGEIKVGGKTYNQPMPANPHLQDLDIAELMTFINKEFQNEEKLITTEEVNKVLKECNKAEK